MDAEEEGSHGNFQFPPEHTRTTMGAVELPSDQPLEEASLGVRSCDRTWDSRFNFLTLTACASDANPHAIVSLAVFFMEPSLFFFLKPIVLLDVRLPEL